MSPVPARPVSAGPVAPRLRHLTCGKERSNLPEQLKKVPGRNWSWKKVKGTRKEKTPREETVGKKCRKGNNGQRAHKAGFTEFMLFV